MHVRGGAHAGDMLYKRALALDPEHMRTLEGQMLSCSLPSLVEALARQVQRLRDAIEQMEADEAKLASLRQQQAIAASSSRSHIVGTASSPMQ